MACQTCRARKVRCDSERPRCRNCARRSLNCAYLGERIKRRKLNEDTHLPRTAPSAPANAEHTPSVPQGDPSIQSNDVLTAVPEALIHELHLHNSIPNATTDRDHHSDWSLTGTDSTIKVVEQHRGKSSDRRDTRAEDFLDKILANDPQTPPTHRNPSVWIRSEAGDEYTGPSSGISAISEQGLNWIRLKVKGCGCLCNIFRQLRSTLLSLLRQPKCMGPGLWSNFAFHEPQKELPPPETIREYVDAYFSDVQVIFPILNKERFESQLADSLSGEMRDSPSWKALLFAVLASGCRAALSDETAEAFQKSGSEAWSYFVSGLSCEQMLVHVATDLTAVQALVVMTVFAQGLSSPQRLEYTLCSTAVRLAFSLAINRAPPTEWNLTESEKEERSRTFWVIYCVDKTLALRCGRPSIIDDAEISCPFPRVTPSTPVSTSNSGSEGGGPVFDFLLCFTQFARICGRISRGLYSAFAMSQYCSNLTELAMDLLKDLQMWKSSIPAAKRIRKSLSDSESSEEISRTQQLVLQLSYYYGLCAVYRRFSPIFCHSDEDENEVENLLRGAANTSQVEAARSMVLLTKHVDVESYSPGWLIFYYPMTALITLFIHIIRNPSDPSANQDLALMEVAVGFFGRTEYVTSGEAGFTTVTEFVRQARLIVDKSSLGPCSCETGEARHVVSLACSRGAGEGSAGMIHDHISKSAHVQEVGNGTNGIQGLESPSSDLHLDVQTPALDSGAVGSPVRRALFDEPDGSASLSGNHSGMISSNLDFPQLGPSPSDDWFNAWPSPSGVDMSTMGTLII